MPNVSPAGRISLISQDNIRPEPVRVGSRGRSLLTVLLVRISVEGEYDRVGNWSLMVMLIVAFVDPPELFAQIL